MMPQSSSKILEPIEILARRSGLSVEYEIDAFEFVKTKIKVLPYAFVKKHALIPLKKEGGMLYVALSDPFDLTAVEEIRYMTGTPVVERLLPRHIIEKAIEKIYQQNDEAATEFIQGLEESPTEEIKYAHEKEYDLLDNETDSAVIKSLNMILVEALSQGASDIHFEPQESGLIVRYRIDGVLQLRHNMPPEIVSPLTTRIKVLAQLDIAEHRLPQDGRIKLRMGGREIDFRVSTIPIVLGERIVLRILDRTQLLVGFEKMGMRSNLLKKLRAHIRKNQGMILVTGPTGSGKSTTLYSALSEIMSSEINIMTIEDPVEFKIEKMAQISVNSKIDLTFAKGLRHILRQDPDVIMVGEIRDKETAEIAVQAALTGHLVLSTLHTNDAPSAIARLVDMGIEPYLISSSVICILAQRLVRMICPECKKEEIMTKEEAALNHLQLPDKVFEGGVVRFFKGKGCPQCFGSGYKGRCGIYELMDVTSKVKRQILSSAESSDIKRIAQEEGMESLTQEGIKFALQGKTTIDEIIRITSGAGDSTV